MPHDARVRIVLVGGHESAEGTELARLCSVVDGAAWAAPGREFHNLVSRELTAGETVVVVPMTFGRNPTMVADTAKTLAWLGVRHPGRLALTAPFGQPDHLIAWLRTAANKTSATDAASALLAVAPPSNPFDEAELHRIAYLVATHGSLGEVGVAIAGDEPELAAAVDRMRRLGAVRVVTVPAGFAAELPDAAAEFAGPLMSDAAIARVIRTRVRDALEALDDGYDGIAAGLEADHGHGYAHSHAFEASTGASHAHSHPHGSGRSHSHGAGHPHSHGPGHPHDHSHDDDHEHGHTHAHHH